MRKALQWQERMKLYHSETPGVIVFRFEWFPKLLENASFEVKDRGMGIHQRALRRLFEIVKQKYYLEEGVDGHVDEPGILIDMRMVEDLQQQKFVVDIIQDEIGSEGEWFDIYEKYEALLMEEMKEFVGDSARMVGADISCFPELEGRYLFLNKVGQGTIGRVYRTYDIWCEREVAMKILDNSREHFETEQEFESHFLQEVQTQARLRHPAAPVMYSARRAGEKAYQIMELVKGSTLLDLVRNHGALPLMAEGRLPGALDIMIQLCEVLDCLHTELGLIHRDVKPANIMVTDSGKLKLLDFGICISPQNKKLRSCSDLETLMWSLQVKKQLGNKTRGHFLEDTTIIESMMCTLPFAAPEYLASEEIDFPYDIYSAGVTLYQMLSGRLPIEFRSCHQFQECMTDWHLGKKDPFIYPLDIIIKEPQELATLVEQKMMNPRPEERATAKELAQAFRRIRDEWEGKMETFDQMETKRHPVVFNVRTQHFTELNFGEMQEE